MGDVGDGLSVRLLLSETRAEWLLLSKSVDDGGDVRQTTEGREGGSAPLSQISPIAHLSTKERSERRKR